LIIQYNASTVPILQYASAAKRSRQQTFDARSEHRAASGLLSVPGVGVPYSVWRKQRVVPVDLDLKALERPEPSAQELVTASTRMKSGFPERGRQRSASMNIQLISIPVAAHRAVERLPIKTVEGP